MNFYSAMDKARKGFQVQSRLTGNIVYTLDGCNLYCNSKVYCSGMMDILSEWDVVEPSLSVQNFNYLYLTPSKVQNEQIGNFI
ncbi:hypothetical protein SJ_52 [Proteus phage SJ_PmiM]|nr:hypothetical protein SJ_52 [Proteus phage SJ_PmiM]